MEEFRLALKELVAVLQKEGDNPAPAGARLAFVVDELDRCRPDYALEVVEVIKHYFAIRVLPSFWGNLTPMEFLQRKAMDKMAAQRQRFGPKDSAQTWRKLGAQVNLRQRKKES